MTPTERMRLWRAANPEKVAAQNARRRERYDAGKRADRRAYDANNRERLRAWGRAYYAANRDRRLREADEWRRANPEKARARCAKRRAMMAGANGSHTLEEWAALCDEFDNRCAYCGALDSLERDHVVPLSKGGSDFIENIRPACKSCNASKHNKGLDEWHAIRLPAETQVSTV